MPVGDRRVYWIRILDPVTDKERNLSVGITLDGVKSHKVEGGYRFSLEMVFSPSGHFTTCRLSHQGKELILDFHSEQVHFIMVGDPNHKGVAPFKIYMSESKTWHLIDDDSNLAISKLLLLYSACIQEVIEDGVG